MLELISDLPHTAPRVTTHVYLVLKRIQAAGGWLTGCYANFVATTATVN